MNDAEQILNQQIREKTKNMSDKILKRNYSRARELATTVKNLIEVLEELEKTSNVENKDNDLEAYCGCPIIDGQVVHVSPECTFGAEIKESGVENE